MRVFPALSPLIDAVLPPRCPGCAAIIAVDHAFCADCWAGLHFLGPPACAGCQRPFAYDRGPGARCAACLAAPPVHAGVHAAVAYGQTAKALVLRLKYGGRTALASTAAAHMARLMPPRVDLLVPVPLHRWRLWARGFNQAALIGAALARLTGVPHDPLLLRRHRATPVLRGLGARARAKAVAGAFTLALGARDTLAGKALVLVDDVYTSGATTNACAALLRRGGADSVTILCWARVLRESEDD